MRVLLVTNMYPHAEDASYGAFVYEQVRALRAAGASVDALFVNGRATRTNYLLAYPRFWWRLARRRYDLVHAHYVFSGLIARAQPFLPVVQSFHAPGLLGTWQGALCRALHPLVDGVIVTSEQHRADLGCPRARIIPCGVDPERFRPGPRAAAREALGWPPERDVLLWLGEPRPEKRVDLVRATYERLRPDHPGLDLRLVSRLPHERVPLALNAADVMLLASDYEGSPVVIKEAMACNLPIVSTAVGDVPELFRGVEGCRLSAPHPDALAAAVAELLASGRRSAGREAIRRYSTAHEARQVLALYEDVLAARRGRRAVPPAGSGGRTRGGRGPATHEPAAPSAPGGGLR